MTDDHHEPTEFIDRKDLHRRVHARLGAFGREIADLVLEFALRPAWMQFFLRKLGLNDAGHLDGQLDDLARHLTTADLSKFLMRARREIWIEMQKLGLTKTTQSRMPSEAVPKRVRASSGGPEFTRRSPPPPPMPRPAPANPTKLHEVDWLESEPAAEEEPASAWINLPGYSGPDRRRRKSDRRSGQGRRKAIDPVAVKRRFSADRRKHPKGRRSTDK